MIDKIIENWRRVQDTGAWLPCPRCGLMKMSLYYQRTGISKHYNLEICPDCVIDEELAESTICPQHKPLPIEQWFVVKSVYGQSGAVHLPNGNFKLKVEQEILLTRQDIDDIMVSALEGGITYWADAANVIEEKRVADWGHEQIARGGVLMIHDFEEDETYELTLEKFLTGFKLWFENGHDSCGAVSGHEVDCGMIDGNDADGIIQYALFGDWIYG